MEFINDDFILKNEHAITLYHNYAKKMPIIDYHCHVNPKEIAEDLHYENLTQVWLKGDHYKWRIIRANGVDESLITGDSSDYNKFLCYAEAVSKSVGNPLYAWTHLELKRYFDCDLILNKENAPRIWEICNKVLQDGLSVRKMIEMYNVKTICTTDDPIDDLRWHKIIKDDKSFNVKVLPAFRPDKAFNIESSGFNEYISILSTVTNIKIAGLDDLFSALLNRIEYFSNVGCKLSDHALKSCFFRRDKGKAETALKKAMTNNNLTDEEVESYQTELLLFFAKVFAQKDWTMQLHYGAIRNVNSKMFNILGPDTGYDSIGSSDNSLGLAKLLDGMSLNYKLPRIVVYSINPNDNAMIDSIIGSFQTGDLINPIQHGCPWWFNDTKLGIENYLSTLSSIGVLGNIVGMLTDSRSFLSYTRHEYFRRILCNYIGSLVENGEYPNDIEYLGKIVEDISYSNAVNYFKF